MQLKVIMCVSCLVLLAHTAIAQLLQASLAVIVIAGLAIAKEKLIAAEIHRNYIRGPHHEEPSYGGYGHKRVGRAAEEAETSFAPLYESALELDTDDCAKLMVCHVFEKPADQLNSFEQKIQRLFVDDGVKVDPQSPRAVFQLAAYVGGLRQPGLCHQRYPKCLANPEDLTKIAQ